MADVETKESGGGGMNDDWKFDCSDEELPRCGSPSASEDDWRPPAAELAELFANIESGGGIALQWRSPGRMSLTPVTPTSADPVSGPAADNEPASTEFEFLDEVNSVRLRVRRESEDTLRGSAKKKTSSFDGILSNMKRHMLIQQRERAGNDSGPP